MTCAKYPRMLSRLLDGELSPAEIAEAEGHAARCASCSNLVASWRLQGAHLRRHLHRRALSEDFIRKVCQAAMQDDRPAAARERRRNLTRWLPIAAAILLAAVFISQYFAGREARGYARVMDPGERLEVRPADSAVWVRTSAGEILRPGAWLRTPASAAAEIQWHDFVRLTLEPGTLARIPELPQTDHVTLLSGSILSEVRIAGKNFRVVTPAGSVTGSSGRFSVQVRDVTLTNLRVDADGAEMMSGTVVPVGGARVHAGSMTVEASGATTSFSAGQAAVFSESRITGLDTSRAPVEASLKAVSRVPGPGTISSTLVRAEGGLNLDFDAAHASLKRLLECATGARVRMAEDVAVTGSLRIPVASGPESVISAIGAALQRPISLQHVTARLPVAAAQQDQPPSAGQTTGSYTLEKYPNGTVSYDFVAVPAGRAFQILRSAVTDLPELEDEAACTPITAHAQLVSPKTMAAQVSDAMGFQIRSSEATINVIEVGTASPEGGAAAPVTEPGAAQLREARTGPAQRDEAGPTRREETDSGSSGTVPQSRERSSEGRSVHLRPSILPMSPAWYLPGGGLGISGWAGHAAPASDTQSTLGGRASPKIREFFGQLEPAPQPALSLHLIWPALGAEAAAGREEAYLVTNHWALPAHTLWHGYDCRGQLTIRVTIFVSADSTASVVPLRDLPANLGEGGHWETTSDLPVVGSRDSGSGDGQISGLPWAFEQLPRQWYAPALWVSEYDGKVWLVNPGDQEAVVVVAIMLDGQALAAECLTVQPHGSTTWPGPSFQEDFRALGSGTKAMVVVHVLHGAAAAGPAR